MNQRSNTQETLVIALELLRRIPRSRKITAKELHEQLQAAGFNRDLRTIQRSLEMLSAHFDIERDERSKPYGYRWSPKAVGISMPTLTEQESLLLTLAEEYLKNLLPPDLSKSMQTFFQQARYNLDFNNPDSIENQWRDKVKIVSTNQQLLPPKIDGDIFETVSRALYHNKWLYIEYRNAAGDFSNIEVMPLGLAQQGSRLYLVCRYKGFNNERNLALHRMLSAEISTIGFTPPTNFCLDEYNDNGRFGFSEGKKVQISFSISKTAGGHLFETPLSEDQVIVEQEDHLEITATVINSLHLKWWLRAFGDEAWNIGKTEL